MSGAILIPTVLLVVMFGLGLFAGLYWRWFTKPDPTPASPPVTPESVKDAARAVRRGEWTDRNLETLVDAFTSERRLTAWATGTPEALTTARNQAHGAALFVDFVNHQREE